MSRNKHLDREEALAAMCERLEKRNSMGGDNCESMSVHELLEEIDDAEGGGGVHVRSEPDAKSQRGAVTRTRKRWASRTKKRIKVCGEHFFEHFLDGSAGVMYTSFLGLIITELVTLGTGTGKY
eukprot:CAMPEP_0174899118 /NCGR_PEP_ID=MMETSP0167-20121228/25505_1 /TAXON_ID=38298 /ORGANISM="Rhodella maculata, Strain CCMP736" /LENGTH=123 /DNA_ID=CAMNT_0016139989 /DNA_START=319 /DNA_END=690 /DNA_ORIENTATION=-